MKINELLKIDKKLIDKHGILNLDPFLEHRIYINVARVFNSDIPEFENAKEIIWERLFEKAMQLYSKKMIFGEKHEQFLLDIDNWDLKEGKSAKGYFGNAQVTGIGKALGKVKKRTLVDGIGYILEEVIKALDDKNKIKASLINFLPKVLHNIDADNISDILLNIFKPELTKYTKRKIKELKIDSISFEGLIKFEKNKKLKSEFLYPDTFFTNLPYIDNTDFNSLGFLNDEWNEARNSLSSLFYDKKQKALKELDEIDKIDGKTTNFIIEMIKFRNFRSTFNNLNFKCYRFDIANAYQYGRSNTIDEDVVLRACRVFQEVEKSKIDYITPYKLKYLENNVEDYLYGLFNMYDVKNLRRQSKEGQYGINDITFSLEKSKILIELKVLNDKSEINNIVHGFNNQMETYNLNQHYDKNYYIIFATNLEIEDYKNLINALNSPTESEKILKKFIIVASYQKRTASAKSSSFRLNTAIYEDLSDISKDIVPPNEIKEIINLKGEYTRLSGKRINSIEKEKIQKEITDVKVLRSNLIEGILRNDDSASKILLNEHPLISLETQYKDMQKLKEKNKKEQ